LVDEPVGFAEIFLQDEIGIRSQMIPSVAPLANSLFHYQPNSNKKPKIRLEATYQAADQAVQNVVDLLAA